MLPLYTRWRLDWLNWLQFKISTNLQIPCVLMVPLTGAFARQIDRTTVLTATTVFTVWQATNSSVAHVFVRLLLPSPFLTINSQSWTIFQSPQEASAVSSSENDAEMERRWPSTTSCSYFVQWATNNDFFLYDLWMLAVEIAQNKNFANQFCLASSAWKDLWIRIF